ncbi:50S ribosomal protein L18 [Candidatus Kaiserbacteria bacterium]|nr:50S ribosomal protein L18 [Candidatus Kaiserbacteria bacterium]
MSKLTPKTKKDLRLRRHRRIRARVKGTAERPRLAVFRSNKFVYAQVIDDDKGMTLASASSRDVKGKTMTEDAKIVGERIAKAAIGKGVKKVVFDRGGFTFSARIRGLAEAARAGGLEF